jgi:hypothetical protein
MAKEHDFIPSNDAKFDAFYKNYCQIVTQRTSGQDPEWTHIPAARVTELNAGYAAWYTAWSKLRQPLMDADVAAKNDAKAAGGKIIRAFTNEFIRYSTAVSIEDKRSLGVHIPDPTPIPDPATRPEFGVKLISAALSFFSFSCGKRAFSRRRKIHSKVSRFQNWLF